MALQRTSSSSSLVSPPLLSRPSALSLRPLGGIQAGGRLRARSITTGTSAPPPQAEDEAISPTLVGTPQFALGSDGEASDPSKSAVRSSPRIKRAYTLSNLGRPPSFARSPKEEPAELPLTASPRVRQLSGSEEDESQGSSEASTSSGSPLMTPVDRLSDELPLVLDDPAAPEDAEDEDGRWISLFSVSDKMRGKRRTASIEHAGVGERPQRPVRQSKHVLRRGKSFVSVDMSTSELYEILPPFSPPAAAEARRTLSSFAPEVATLGAIFVGSTFALFALIMTLPSLTLPHSLSELPVLTSSLEDYRQSSNFAALHTFGILSLLFVWKQAFSIPGSVLMNVLFGALYGTTVGTIWSCLWTATGSLGAYGIARVISPLVEHYFAAPLLLTRKTLQLTLPAHHPASPATSPALESPDPVATGSSDLFTHLLLARFFPLLPYSVLNLMSGVLRLPITPFFITLVIGSWPFNFVTVSIGEVVASVSAAAGEGSAATMTNKIWSPEVLRKLVLVTVVSVVPVLFKKKLESWIGAAIRGIIRAGELQLGRLERWKAARGSASGGLELSDLSEKLERQGLLRAGEDDY